MIIHKKQRIRNRSYILPNPARSYEEYLEVYNLDLEKLDILELRKLLIRSNIALANLSQCERKYIFLNAYSCIDAETWLLQRIAAIRAEIRSREGRGS